MRIAFVADVHLANHKRFGGVPRSGINARARAIIDTLAESVRIAVEEQDCDAFVVCGDLFDHTRPEPQIITAVCQIFERHLNAPVRFYVMVGNHDMHSEDEHDHALGPLRSVPNVSIVDKAHTHCWPSVAVLMLPYRTAPVSEWLDDAVAALMVDVQSRDKHRILALHMGVSDTSTAHYLAHARDSVPAQVLGELMDKYNIEFAACGNWHNHQSWVTNGESCIVQCGALVPTGFDNPGIDGYGSLVVYDTDTHAWARTEVDGPRFLTVKGDFAVEQYRDAAEKVPARSLHVVWKGAPTQLGAMAATLAADETALGLASATAMSDDSDEVQVRNAAAFAARAAGVDPETSLRAYVDAMPIDAGVDRDAVLRRALGFLHS